MKNRNSKYCCFPHLHEEHVTCIVRAPVDCERLFLHHATPHRLQVYVIPMLQKQNTKYHINFVLQQINLLLEWGQFSIMKVRCNISIIRTLTFDSGFLKKKMFWKNPKSQIRLIFNFYLKIISYSYQKSKFKGRTRFPIWSRRSLTSWLWMRPMCDLPNRRRDFFLLSCLTHFIMTMKATVL